ncbi:hypothetical protein [uncultured Draconibacterium sp.]|uniref:hypothetical protein n=1 Tax=uncultured Draconibacterium sp. TaxID=1573823 RepID=UPI0029C8E2D5|nr:hypothetical protein [uncultured Draconibacterium sp.]
MGIILAPLKKEKLDAWKDWAKSLTGEQNQAFNEFNKKHGLTRHDAWLAETPDGPVVVALHEGPGADNFLQSVASTDGPFENSFKEKVLEFHDMDITAPPPGPAPVKMISSE